jgi:hypothetical protein
MRRAMEERPGRFAGVSDLEPSANTLRLSAGARRCEESRGDDYHCRPLRSEHDS